MNMEKFYTKEVEIYEKVKALNDRIKDLQSKRDFIAQNYDSNVNVKIEASSQHNYNDKVLKTVSLPVDVILGRHITKQFVLEKLNSEIKDIEEQLEKLNVEFDSLSK